MKITTLLLSTLFLVFGFDSKANVSLPAIFGNHMVLQQKSEITIWGWAKPFEEVGVTGSWDNVTVKVTVPNSASWQVKLNTPTAGGPYTITVKGWNTLVIEDILIGEVWLCSGQSNMEWSARIGIDSAEKEVKNANFPEIRFFSVVHKTADGEQLDLDGEWKVCSPETMIDFSATGYFFGRELNTHLNQPVGLINSSWGGTPAEVWTNPEAIKSNPKLNENANTMPEVPWGPTKPGKTWFTMIEPLVPFKIAGVIWYQGESNTGYALDYTELFSTMITDWRRAWAYDLPFYYAQIAPHTYGRPMEGAVLRESQRLAMKTPNTGMIVTSDITGDVKDIHPRNKQDVGRRLANWALNKNYGFDKIPVSGPIYKGMTIEKDQIRISFDFAEDGLMMKGKELSHFEIAGEDEEFIPAQVKIDGKTVVVKGKGLKKPVAVRFAFNNLAVPNLYNKGGLPASCFRTDNWPISFE